jgi:site-specific recombinase XerD
MCRKILIVCVPCTRPSTRASAPPLQRSQSYVSGTALISLLAATGLQINEALTLARRDVYLDADVLRVTGKYRAR